MRVIVFLILLTWSYAMTVDFMPKSRDWESIDERETYSTQLLMFLRQRSPKIQQQILEQTIEHMYSMHSRRLTTYLARPYEFRKVDVILSGAEISMEEYGERTEFRDRLILSELYCFRELIDVLNQGRFSKCPTKSARIIREFGILNIYIRYIIKRSLLLTVVMLYADEDDQTDFIKILSTYLEGKISRRETIGIPD